MILVDFSQIVFAVGYSKFRHGKFLEREARDGIVTYLLMLERQFRTEFGEMVLCCDRDPSWRRAFYAPYKYKRRAKRAGDRDMQALNDFRRTIEDELRDYFPWRVVGTKWAEGDDVVAALVTTFASARTPVLILSADRDFVQLHRFPGVHQRDPRTREVVVPKEDDLLIEKLIYGDSRDGVPNMLSDDLVFVEGRKQTRMHRHLRERMGVITGKNDIFRVAPEHYFRFRRNEILIDLTRTPQYVKNRILRDYAVPPAADRVDEYVRSHRLRDSHEQLGARYRGHQTQGHLQKATVRDHRRVLPAQRAA